MILSAHILVGAAIAARISNPTLGFLFAFLSHYLFDLLPTKEYSIPKILDKKWGKSFFDFLKIFLDIFGGFLIVFLFSKNIFIAALGGFLAMAPDGITLLSLIFPEKKLLILHQRFHRKINWFKNPNLNEKNPLILGILSQVLVYIFAIFFLR